MVTSIYYSKQSVSVAILGNKDFLLGKASHFLTIALLRLPLDLNYKRPFPHCFSSHLLSFCPLDAAPPPLSTASP